MRVLFLKAGYALTRVYEFLPLPKIPGVLVVLRYEGKVLLVQHSYGNDGWQLPGGLRLWFKSAVDQARAEISQELGIRPPVLEYAGKVKAGARKIDLFVGELTEFRNLKKSPEIKTYGFYKEHELAEQKVELSPVTLSVLGRVGFGAKYAPA